MATDEGTTFSFERLDDDDAGRRLSVVFPKLVDGFVRSQPLGLFMPRTFQRDWPIYRNFALRPDDTWIVSFPKSGTTWTQEMVWLINNSCDFEAAKTLLRERVPFLEDRSLWPDETWRLFHERLMADGVAAADVSFQPNFIADLPSPRFIKTHLPLAYLPVDLLNTSRVVYVARNPKDVAVSWFYHHLLDPIMETTVGIKEFVGCFMRDEVIYAPYWANVLEAWKLRHHPNLLFLFYEDLKSDLSGQIRRVARFFGKDLTDDQVAALTHHLSFSQFKKNPWVNAEELQKNGYFRKEGAFIRKGQIGDWKNHFDKELQLEFNQWIQKNTKGSDLVFPTSETE